MALLTAALLAAQASTSGGTARQPAAGGKPNIVVIYADDLDEGSVEIMDSTRALLEANGVRFENAIVTTPLCCPSRSSFYTGLYTHNHGVVSNNTPDGGYLEFVQNIAPRDTLPVRLQEAGYRTGFVGKYINELERAGEKMVPPGWSEFHGLVGDLYQNYGYSLNSNGDVRRYGRSRRDYQTDVFARIGAEFISQNAGARPFFLTVAPLAVHRLVRYPGDHPLPPAPPPRYRGAFKNRPLPQPPSFQEADVSDKPQFLRRPTMGPGEVAHLTRLYQGRLGALLAVDDAVERLVGALERAGELENTVVVFTSDNGFMLGEHRNHGKDLAYEESIGVPLLIRGPGFPAGEVRAQPVANIDLAPTFLELANGSQGGMDGISLLPIAADPEVAMDRALLVENFDRGRCDYRAVRTATHMYLDAPRCGRELYDLVADPYQLESQHHNPVFATERRDLAAVLNRLKHCSGERCY